MKHLEEYYEQEKEAFLASYLSFLRFPSIATDPAHRKDVEQCASWVEKYMKQMDMSVERWETSGAPTLFASKSCGRHDAQTLLIYGHYDVQPVDPLDLWETPPFEPSIRNGAVYARGALDDKGQCFYALLAIEAFLKQRKSLPLNIKILIEGEEESGSKGLSEILESKKEKLQADHLLIVDSGMHEPRRPAITLGARGIVTMTVTLSGSNVDLHSGMVGGAAYNPNRALVEILAKLHNNQGSVTLPGFYDEVVEMTRAEKELFSLDLPNEEFERIYQVKPTGSERGVTPLEAISLRPTLEINGISGGYAGAGFKTVIPAIAKAKVSCRLVPRQRPEMIAHTLKEFFLSNAPEGIAVEVELHQDDAAGFRTNPQSKVAKAMEASYSEVFGRPCERLLLGGSIPIAAKLCAASGAEMVLVGVGLPSDLIHAPNEHFGLDRFKQGFLTIARGIELLGEK